LFRGWEQVPEEEIDVADHATNLFTREAVHLIHEHAQHSPDNPLFL
jgi:hypothetical protein